MCDSAVRFAVAHRRTVGPARRVHQDRRLAAIVQALENARRGVTLHPYPLRAAEAGFVEEGAHHGDALSACRKTAIADIADIAHVGTELRGKRESDVETIRRQEPGGAIRPFHEYDRA